MSHEFQSAERLIGRALSGNPPADIAEELRDLLIHEVAFAAAEAAVEIGGFAGGAFDRAFDKGEGVVETGSEFGGDDVGF